MSVVDLFPPGPTLEERWLALSDVEKSFALAFIERVKTQLSESGLELDDEDTQEKAVEAMREMFFPGPKEIA